MTVSSGERRLIQVTWCRWPRMSGSKHTASVEGQVVEMMPGELMQLRASDIRLDEV